jgi:hypothetical protein
MRVQVDEARQRDQPVGVDNLCAGAGQVGADLGDGPVGQHEVDRIPAEQPGALEYVGRGVCDRHAGTSPSVPPESSR